MGRSFAGRTWAGRTWRGRSFHGVTVGPGPTPGTGTGTSLLEDAPRVWQPYNYEGFGATFAAGSFGNFPRAVILGGRYGGSYGGGRPYTLVTGGTYLFQHTAYKGDDAFWDLTDATVKFYLKRPDAEDADDFTEYATTIVDGEAFWSSNVFIFDMEGDWASAWQIEMGSVVVRSQSFAFQVEKAP